MYDAEIIIMLNQASKLVPVTAVIDRQNYPVCPVNIVAYRSSMTGKIFLTQKNASEIEFSLFRKTLLL